MRKRYLAFQIVNRKRTILLIASIVLISAVGYGQFWFRRSSSPQIFGKAVVSVNAPDKE